MFNCPQCGDDRSTIAPIEPCAKCGHRLTVPKAGKSGPEPATGPEEKAKVVAAATAPAEPTEAAPKKAEPKKVAPTEAAPTEAAPKKAAPTEAEPKKAAPTEAEPKKVAPKEAAPKKAAPKEAAPTEAAPKKAAPKEAEPKEAAPKKARPPTVPKKAKPPTVPKKAVPPAVPPPSSLGASLPVSEVPVATSTAETLIVEPGMKIAGPDMKTLIAEPEVKTVIDDSALSGDTDPDAIGAGGGHGPDPIGAGSHGEDGPAPKLPALPKPKDLLAPLPVSLPVASSEPHAANVAGLARFAATGSTIRACTTTASCRPGPGAPDHFGAAANNAASTTGVRELPVVRPATRFPLGMLLACRHRAHPLPTCDLWPGSPMRLSRPPLRQQRTLLRQMLR